ncbi:MULTISPECIES: intradiol ring-cleavage dioxygenase [Ensifer]|uniref:intradiol ring-cleavage dioxygenase n=1 Tax=Ensifer TaxID=106591 RepID=UPI00042F2508|nr:MULTISPECIES: intradiol ring-cleavage dioxygenase [Ensifer]AHK46522.1 catechol 1,2-dioxygenase protein [Ensifer adhaerens OV14]MDP9632695.1 catechol 1,2-dioxygenase [Ensifer adhaerens]KQY72494.1 hydroxyquinol 1,2-dioxygenase [Ensifer sp. Root142]MBD9489471.1 intradiol ring-cleavage dioxygenase [Ensifer sp. ENS11]NOV17784.1 hydroxyquinol 1,2-dioxygenase [Ensifer canadensis]
MRNVTIENVTDVVLESLGKHKPCAGRRREIIAGLIRHLHAFCREVNVTHAEFIDGCNYLMRAGQMCDGKRQEFILLGDILGVEVLVDMLTNPVRGNESASTVLGPFYRENPPVLPKGASTVQKHFDNEETVLVEGYVRDTAGNPIAGVTLDVWEDAPNGLYEQQDPDQPEYNLRGRFETDENGHYAFRAIRPLPYPIPYDGTAGELLNYMGHHPWRPGHIHFMLFKEGYRTLISQIFDGESDYLENDSVFAVKESLVGHFQKTPSGGDTDLILHFDFTLPALAASMAAE